MAHRPTTSQPVDLTADGRRRADVGRPERAGALGARPDASSSRPTTAWCTRSTTCRSTCTTTRRSASWGSRARARASRRWRSSGCCPRRRRSPATCGSGASRSSGLPEKQLEQAARLEDRDGVPGRARRAEPGAQGGQPDRRGDRGPPGLSSSRACASGWSSCSRSSASRTRRQRVDQYPHEYSGGMRQRAMIAMAIANDPDLLIADEPTTALDVTIQAQVLEVLERIQDRTELVDHADHPRPRRRRRRRRPGARDVRAAGRSSAGPSTRSSTSRATRTREGLLASLPRLDRRSDKNEPAAPDQGPAAVADLPAAGVRVPSAVPDGRGARPCATRSARSCALVGPRPLVGVPLRRAARRGRGGRARRRRRRRHDVGGVEPEPLRRRGADAGPRGERPGEELPDPGRAVQAQGRRRAGGLRRELHRAAGRDARAGGGVGLREVDDRALRPAPARADVGLGALRRRDVLAASGVGAADAAREDADRLPGPVRVARTRG